MMLLVLRIVVVVGAIFWLSPLRPPLPWASQMVATAPQAERSGNGELDRVGRLVRAWEALSDDDRALALKGLSAIGPNLAGTAPDMAAKALPDRKAKP